MPELQQRFNQPNAEVSPSMSNYIALFYVDAITDSPNTDAI